MPLTRKGANVPVKATRSHGTVSVQTPSPATRSRDGRKTTTDKKAGKQQRAADEQPEKNTCQQRKETKSNKYEDPSLMTKNIDSVKPEENTVPLSKHGTRSDTEITANKRKLSAGVLSEEEPTKRAKLASPASTLGPSPRRSSRAVIPNSRYKDMEVLDIGKKKLNTDTELLKNRHGKDKMKAGNSQTNNLLQSGISVSIVTGGSYREMEENQQMNLMDDLLILPSSITTLPQSTTESKAILSQLTTVKNKQVQQTSMENADSVTHSTSANTNRQSDQTHTSEESTMIHTNTENTAYAVQNVDTDAVDLLQAGSSGLDKMEIMKKETVGKADETTGDCKKSNKVSSLNEKAIVKEVKTSANMIEVIPVASQNVNLNQPVEKSWNVKVGKDDGYLVSQLDTKLGSGSAVPLPSIITVPQTVRVTKQASDLSHDRGKKPSLVQKPVIIKRKDPNVNTSSQSSSIDGQTPVSGSKELLHSSSSKEKAVPSSNIIEIEGVRENSVKLNEVNTEVVALSKDTNREVDVKISDTIKPNVHMIYVTVKQKNTNKAVQKVDYFNVENNASVKQDEKSQQTLSSGNTSLQSLGNELDSDNSNLMVGEPLIAMNDEGKTVLITNESGTNITEEEAQRLDNMNNDDNVIDPTVTAGDTETKTEPLKQNGAVCELIKVVDQGKESSPQVAIEYVVFGDRIVPIHKPFSHTNAAAGYKKRSNTLRRVPAKVAQTAISSVLEGIEKYNKPPNAAFTIDTEDPMEEESTKTETLDSTPSDLPDGKIEDKDPSLQIIPGSVTGNYQQKPGRVLPPGLAYQPDANPGSTEIVEISQDLFAKEVYREDRDTILDPVTGQMVSESMLTVNKTEDMEAEKGDDDDASMKEVVPDDKNEAVSTTADAQDKLVPASELESADCEKTVTEASNIMKVQTSDVEAFSLENMSEGESVTLQIDNDGVVLGETAPPYKIIKDVKINPAIQLLSTTSSGKQTEKGRDSSIEARSGSPKVVQIQPVRASGGPDIQREIETQTEDMEDEMDDGADNSDQTSKKADGGKAIVVFDHKEGEDKIRRTTVMMEEDGQLQEYVVVHLPEGAEIKHQEVKQFIKDPIHNEVVTMSEDGMYICVDCDHKTDRKGNWYKHRRKHLGIRPHACTKCSYKAATSSNLKRHMQIHDDVRNYVCNTCGLYFRQKIHLERHIKYKHQEKKIKCPLCDYLCSSENPDLKIHIRRRHMPQEDGSMSAFTCNECGLMTVSKKDLKQHMKFHKKGPELKLFCEFCSFVTDCESRLRRHMLIHSKEKPFQCGLCSYRASQKEHVLRHMKTQHDVVVERRPRRSLLSNTPKQKPKRSLLDPTSQSACSTAESTEDEASLDDKLEETSTNTKMFEKSDYSSTDKIFACNHCSMKFSKLINLYKHLFAQHKQVMPETSSNFQCVVCDFRTNNKKNLLVHMRKHNMHDHSPPTHVYSCVLCRYINPRRRNLFQHMKKKHGIEIMMKEDGYNCYISGDVVVGNAEGEEGIMALSEIITRHPLVDDAQLQIVADDGTSFQAEKMSLDNIISMEDIGTYESASPEANIPTQITTLSTTPFHQSTIAEHEAAEAIEGLQALAEQAAGVVETQPLDSDITTEIITSDIMTDGEIITTGEETTLVEEAVDDGIELSPEQLNQLSAGDYVEINGEVYKVEISQENANKMELP